MNAMARLNAAHEAWIDDPSPENWAARTAAFDEAEAERSARLDKLNNAAVQEASQRRIVSHARWYGK